jgi:hypothetical protein
LTSQVRCGPGVVTAPPALLHRLVPRVIGGYCSDWLEGSFEAAVSVARWRIPGAEQNEGGNVKVEIGVPFREATQNHANQNCPLWDGLHTHVAQCSFNAKGYSYSFRGLVQLESSRAPPCALRNAVLSRRAQQAPPSVASRIRLCSRKWIPEPPSSPGRRAHLLA